MKQKNKRILAMLISCSCVSGVFAEVFLAEDTSNWLGYAATCASAETNHIAVTPSTLPLFWTGNTVYDFEPGVYNLSSSIAITQNCTALVGKEGVIINGNGSTVISVTSTYDIIKDIKINGNTADAITVSPSDGTTIAGTTIFNANRGIFLSTATNSIVRDTKIFGSAIGVSLANNANNNTLHNIIIFNNSQHGIYINAGYRNAINNSLIFNNTTFGLYIQAGTQNAINNSLFYNNSSNGIRMSVGTNYVHAIKAFNNTSNVFTASSTGYGINSADVAFPVGLKFGGAADSILGTIGWSQGGANTGLVVTGSEIFNPYDGVNYLVDTSLALINRKGVKSFGTGIDMSYSKFGQNLPNQIQPVQWNAGGTQLVSSQISFSSSRKVGQSASTTQGGGGLGLSSSTSHDPVCGNTVVEAGESCDDGNVWNGDGCTSTCSLEQPGVCGNGILEYTEWCDDGNTKDNDGCTSTCQIESAAIYTSKQLLQQTALQKSMGFPSAVIDTTTVKDTAQLMESTIEQHQKQQTEQCQYADVNYRKISFMDLKGSPYEKEIETLLNYCIIQGKQGPKNQKIFGRKETTTHAEFIKVLVKTHFLGSSMDFHNNTFDIKNIYADVVDTARYTPFIIKAYVHDLLLPLEKAKGNKLYIVPEQKITRLEAVTLLLHTLKLANKNPQNIEKITDTFQDANALLTREEMAALLVHGYELNYSNSLRVRSDNAILIKLLAQYIQKYPQKEQLILLQNVASKLQMLNENILKKYNIYKQELLADIATLIDFSDVFLK